MPEPFVSVVVPAWNRAARIGPVLEGLRAQTFPDFEVIVVDDGSTDDTAEVAAATGDPRIRVIRQSNAGAPAARNRGLAEAVAPYVVFVDSDDRVHPELLATHAALLRGTGHVLSSTGLEVVTEGGGSPPRVAVPRDLGPAFHGLKANFMPGVFCVDRELLRAVGGYAPLPAGQQKELGLRLAAEIARRGATVTSTPAVRYTYVIHADAHIRRNHDAVYRGDAYILEHHRDALARSPRTLAKYLDEAAVSAVRTGRIAEARALFRELAGVRPGPSPWLRYGLTLAPPVARRVWSADGRSLAERVRRRLRSGR